MIIDFGEEKKRRRRYTALDGLMSEAHQHLRNIGMDAEGILVIIKSPGSNGSSNLNYLEDGMTRWDLETLVKKLLPDEPPKAP